MIDKDIKETIPFMIISKNLEITLINQVKKNLCNKNFKTLKKGIEEDSRRG